MSDNLPSPAFERENRYIVIKRKNMHADLLYALQSWMERVDVPGIECVVVEKDWPEYEPVWKMIEARVCGACDGTGYKDYAGFAMDPCDHKDGTNG